MWTKGHELNYWNKTGLQKGSYIYDNYAEVFKLKNYDFSDKIVADIGCGPFGGCFVNIKTKRLILIDILSVEYNLMKKCPINIIFGDLSKKLPIDSDFCDFVICTNSLDHIPNIKRGSKELNRILKNGGALFLHVHLRPKNQLNKAHVHVLNINKICKTMETSNFIVKSANEDLDWVNGEKNRKAAYLVLVKKNV